MPAAITLSILRDRLDRDFPDWREWSGDISFVGMLRAHLHCSRRTAFRVKDQVAEILNDEDWYGPIDQADTSLEKPWRCMNDLEILWAIKQGHTPPGWLQRQLRAAS